MKTTAGAGLFHHIQLKAPLRNDDTLYRLAKCQYDILMVGFLIKKGLVSGFTFFLFLSGVGVVVEV